VRPARAGGARIAWRRPCCTSATSLLARQPLRPAGVPLIREEMGALSVAPASPRQNLAPIPARARASEGRPDRHAPNSAKSGTMVAICRTLGEDA
jgi:hypothetical protein